MYIYKSFAHKVEEGSRLKYIKEFFAGRKFRINICGYIGSEFIH